MRGASWWRRSSDQREREAARREITLREKVSSREVLVLGLVLGLTKVAAGIRQEPVVFFLEGQLRL
jgi:hypothetical protein